jgi:exodeoxyribonuclease VII small subunit
MAKTPANLSQPTFESALERLEQIVGEMEGDRLALEDLLARYEEGTSLVKVCQQRLDAAEKRIEIISRGPEATVQLDPFDPLTPPAPVVPAAAPTPRPTASKKPAPPAAAEDVSLF